MNTIQLDRHGLEQIINLAFAKHKPVQVKRLSLTAITAQAICLQIESSISMLGTLDVELQPQAGSALVFAIEIKAGMKTPIIKGLLKSFLPFEPNNWLLVDKELMLKLDMPKLLQHYGLQIEFQALQLSDNQLQLTLA